VAYEIKAGDVVVIPAGTGHWFTRIDDHIDYLMVRIDPDKVTPLKSAAQSRDYLSKPAASRRASSGGHRISSAERRTSSFEGEADIVMSAWAY
jgi:AraC-like ligand binding domain